MEKMYLDYKDIAEFYIVYIREAHAADSDWAVPYAKEKNVLQHKDYGQRCQVADRLIKEKKLTIPILIDDMKNTAGSAYQAWPDRAYLVRTNGILEVAGGRGPWGFAPALKEIEKWLGEFRKLGREPGATAPNNAAPTSQAVGFDSFTPSQPALRNR